MRLRGGMPTARRACTAAGKTALGSAKYATRGFGSRTFSEGRLRDKASPASAALEPSPASKARLTVSVSSKSTRCTKHCQEPVSIVGSYVSSMLTELRLGVMAELLLAPILSAGADQEKARREPPGGLSRAGPDSRTNL
jgi:hypothetical protein